MQVPETRYAWNGDIALAYQVFGQGPVDLVYLQGYTSHVDLNWASRYLARFLRGLASHARVIMTDRRGWGCSDRFSPGDVAPLEVQVDLVAVMDATGSERAVIFGSWETALTAMLFAAGLPERTAGLVLCDPFVTYLATPETPWMYSQEDWDAANDEVRRAWAPLSTEGRPGTSRTNASSPSGTCLGHARASPREPSRPSPTASRRWTSGGVLPLIQAPTLIVAGTDEMANKNAAFLAERIAGSRLVEPTVVRDRGWFHWYGRGPAIVEGVAGLLTEVRDEQESIDRVLATVLFTDIVGSTERATKLGDRAWHELLEHHHAAVRGMLARYRGREIDTAGDGFLATFDGPARAIRCAVAISGAVRALGIEIRAGVHTGEVELAGDDVRGIAVHIGARVSALAGPGEVLVSQTVKDLVVGSGIVFEDAGEHELKGVPDPWRLYRAVT